MATDPLSYLGGLGAAKAASGVPKAADAASAFSRTKGLREVDPIYQGSSWSWRADCWWISRAMGRRESAQGHGWGSRGTEDSEHSRCQVLKGPRSLRGPESL